MLAIENPPASLSEGGFSDIRAVPAPTIRLVSKPGSRSDHMVRLSKSFAIDIVHPPTQCVKTQGCAAMGVHLSWQNRPEKSRQLSLSVKPRSRFDLRLRNAGAFSIK